VDTAAITLFDGPNEPLIAVETASHVLGHTDLSTILGI
jgi:hypothetical protein